MAIIKLRSISATVLTIGAAWLAGCAQTSVRSAWQDNVPRNQSFKRVLVIALSPNFNQRCAFEFSLVSQIVNGAQVAMASCDYIKSDDKLTRESVERAVASSGADAVLTTSLVTGDLGAKEGGGRDSRGGGYYKATGFGYATDYYGVYGIPVTYGAFVESPSITTVQGEVHLLSKLYETKGAKLLYTMDTNAHALESRESALMAITPEIADRLRRDGLTH